MQEGGGFGGGAVVEDGREEGGLGPVVFLVSSACWAGEKGLAL